MTIHFDLEDCRVTMTNDSLDTFNFVTFTVQTANGEQQFDFPVDELSAAVEMFRDFRRKSFERENLYKS